MGVDVASRTAWLVSAPDEAGICGAGPGPRLGVGLGGSCEETADPGSDIPKLAAAIGVDLALVTESGVGVGPLAGTTFVPAASCAPPLAEAGTDERLPLADTTLRLQSVPPACWLTCARAGTIVAPCTLR